MRPRRFVSLLLLAAYLPACTSYKVTTTPLPELVAPPKPAKELKIWLMDGRHFVLNAPSLRNDSLFGTEGGRTTDARAVAFPIDSIRSVEVPAGPGTAAIVVSAVAATGLVALMASCSDWEC